MYVSLARHTNIAEWDVFGDLRVSYLDKTSALLISINLWVLWIYPHLSGLASGPHVRVLDFRENTRETRIEKKCQGG